ncbi:MAG: hypothetical protein Unbinned7794contig1000_50 [Prokaryotic dsDNA virus sp.]|nr:MAG: hypothetical protein Unbinned7794contig1000_50 [Prokaryotic dsDNA virus sp.]|tara:strand:+ start:3502 stop:3690 length:189 start_codon:yes stop_codon:yes gene_type:complete
MSKMLMDYSAFGKKGILKNVLHKKKDNKTDPNAVDYTTTSAYKREQRPAQTATVLSERGIGL